MTKNLRELEQIQEKLEYQNDWLKVFVAEVISFDDAKSKENLEDRMLELENLVNTYGGVVILKHIQKRWNPDYNTYIWGWRLEEIMQEMQESWAQLLILWNILKPHQIYKINEKLKTIWAKAWDRVDLILKIFEKNAKTEESRLQIELASIKHMWPRIFDMWMELWSQWSWGSKLSRWKWETNTEIMKRHLEKRILNIKKDLEHYKKVREVHRNARIKKWLNTVWIVWYTNAWKSSLMNVLTWKWVLSENKLFATLWTSVGKMILFNNDLISSYKSVIPANAGISSKEKLNKIIEDSKDNSRNFNELIDSEASSEWQNIQQEWQADEYIYKKPTEILINDTIWFIRDLPPNLIEAFASTLEDSIESDILLHVVDSSDPKIEEKIKVVDDILENIKANQKKIYVFNKIDLLTEEKIKELSNTFQHFKPLFISSHMWIWIDFLKEIIKNELL